jgi:urease accessory protein UreF
MNFVEIARLLGIGIDAAKFIASVVPSLVELWKAHDQKDDVVIQAIDTALILKRAENDRRLRAKHHGDELTDLFAEREDEPTAEHPLPFGTVKR